MTAADGQRHPEHGLEPLLGINDIVELLRISESGVYRLVRRGELTSVKVGGRTRFEPSAVRAFIAAKRREATAEGRAPATLAEEEEEAA